MQKNRWPFFFFLGGAELSALFVPFDCDWPSSEAAGWSPVEAAELCLASASSVGLEVSSVDACWGESFMDTSSDGAERFTGRKDDDIAMAMARSRGEHAGRDMRSDARLYWRWVDARPCGSLKEMQGTRERVWGEVYMGRDYVQGRSVNCSAT